METVSVRLRPNKIKKLYSGNTALHLYDRRKIKRLKRKGLLLECGKCGPYWSARTSYNTDEYHWRWKIFASDVVFTHSVKLCSLNNINHPSTKKLLKTRFRDFYFLKETQHSDDRLHIGNIEDVHEIYNSLYILFDKRDNLVKWKLTH